MDLGARTGIGSLGLRELAGSIGFSSARGKSRRLVPIRLVPIIIFTGISVWFFALGFRATHDLSFPPEGDAYRDLAIARAIFDGRLGSDPAYAGEVLWYNPLLPAVIAGVSKVTGSALPIVSARCGPYLNLVGGVALFLLLATLFDAWVAAAGATAFYFLIPMVYSQLERSAVTPWAVPWCFAQWLFYLTLFTFIQAIRTDRVRWFAATGVALGLTFLAHTAPAMILGAIMAVVMMGRVLGCLARSHAPSRHGDVDSPQLRGSIMQTLIAALAIVVPAILLALPFLLPIWVRHHFKVLDPIPLNYMDPSMFLESIGARFKQEISSPTTYLSLIGLLV